MKMLMITLLSTVVIVAQAQVTTSITFKISNAGMDVEGRIRAKQVEFSLDEQHPERSNISAVVDASTIETGIEIRDKHLKRADYFDVQRYPNVSIQSIRFERLSRKKIVGVFALTIKDVTREVKIPISISGKGIYNATFNLNRLDFKLGEESVVLDDLVRVKIKHVGT